ncbi:MAG: hypothetical protein RL660_891 [Bacteroidota bacterium]
MFAVKHTHTIFANPRAANHLTICFTFEVMKFMLRNSIFLIMLFAFQQTVNAQVKYFTATINCTQSSSYCGGAAPDDELLEELAKQKPHIGAVYYIVKGSKRSSKIYKKVTADANGVIKVVLPAGKYAVLREDQIKKFVPSINDQYWLWDNKCLQAKHEQPLLLMTVNKHASFDLHVHKDCFWQNACGIYKGPLPS